MQTGLKKERLALLILFVLLGSSAPVLSADQFQQDVVVISHKWYKSPLNLTIPCFRPANEPANENVAEVDTRGGMHCLGNHNPDSSSESQPLAEKPAGQEKETVPEFVYMVRIRNSGPKKIKAILWDYVFADPQTGSDLARHTFFSETELSPGKTKTLVATSPSPPTRVISVRMLIDNDDGNYREQAAIKRIVYADGSVWKCDER